MHIYIHRVTHIYSVNSCNEIMTLDSDDCMNETVVQTLHSMERLEKEQYSKYVNDVLIKKEDLYKQGHQEKNYFTTKNSTAKQQFQQVNSDCNLFSPLFIAAHVCNIRLSQHHRTPRHQNERVFLVGNVVQCNACISSCLVLVSRRSPYAVTALAVTDGLHVQNLTQLVK